MGLIPSQGGAYYQHTTDPQLNPQGSLANAVVHSNSSVGYLQPREEQPIEYVQQHQQRFLNYQVPNVPSNIQQGYGQSFNQVNTQGMMGQQPYYQQETLNLTTNNLYPQYNGQPVVKSDSVVGNQYMNYPQPIMPNVSKQPPIFKATPTNGNVRIVKVRIINIPNNLPVGALLVLLKEKVPALCDNIDKEDKIQPKTNTKYPNTYFIILLVKDEAVANALSRQKIQIGNVTLRIDIDTGASASASNHTQQNVQPSRSQVICDQQQTLTIQLDPISCALLQEVPTNVRDNVFGSNSSFLDVSDNTFTVFNTMWSKQDVENRLKSLLNIHTFRETYYMERCDSIILTSLITHKLQYCYDTDKKILTVGGNLSKKIILDSLKDLFFSTIGILPHGSDKLTQLTSNDKLQFKAKSEGIEVKACCSNKEEFLKLSKLVQDKNSNSSVKQVSSKKANQQKNHKPESKQVTLPAISNAKLKLLQQHFALKSKCKKINQNNLSIVLEGNMLKKKVEIQNLIGQLTDIEIRQEVDKELVDDTKSEISKYLKSLDSIQTAFVFWKELQTPFATCRVALLKNPDNENTVQQAITEIMTGYQKSITLQSTKQLALKEFTKDVKGVVAFRKQDTVWIKGINQDDVDLVYENITATLSNSQTRSRQIYFDNVIEKKVAEPALEREAKQHGLKIMKSQGLIMKLSGKYQDLDKFFNIHVNTILKDARSQIIYDFLPVSHHEYKYWTKSFKELESEAQKYGTEIDYVKSFTFQIEKINNCLVYISNVDILDKRLNADILVNSANVQMQHDSGVAKAIKDAAGKGFDDECQRKVQQNGGAFKTGDVIETRAHNISHVAGIYNAMPPRYSGTSQDAADLQATVVNILKKAESNHVASIAIPPLAMGIFGYPIQKATTIIAETICKHLSSTLNSCIREIHLANKEDKSEISEAYSYAFSQLNFHSTTVYQNFSQDDYELEESIDYEYSGVFRYFDDIKKAYLDYSPNENRLLCEKFLENPKGSFVFEAEQKKKYLVDFGKMIQTNQDTNFQRKIIFVPHGNNHFLKALWFYQDDNNKFCLYRENQCRAIEAAYTEGLAQVEIPMTNTKYTNQDIVYIVKFNNGTFTQVNSQTKYERKVERIPVIRIVECKIDMDCCKQGDLLYVYEEKNDGTLYCAYEAKHFIIQESNVKPFGVTKMEKKKVVAKQKIYMFKVISLKQDKDMFKMHYKQLIQDPTRVRSCTLPTSCTKGIIDTFMENHKAFKTLPPYLIEVDTSKMPIVVKGFKYSVDKFCNKIVFEIANSPSLTQGVIYPSSWTPQLNNLEIVQVANNSNEYLQILNRFKETMPNSTIVSIERIQNKFLYQAFKNEMDRLESIKKELNGSWSCKPAQLFHGTRGTNPILIYNGQDGFDMRFSASGMWGQGIYFAKNASYSNSYGFTSENNTKKMFFADVLLGDYVETPSNNSLRLPPEKPGQSTSAFASVRYDSVKGFTGNSDVFIVYQNSKAYPSYLITYNP
ncbi:hypothetical protein C9374_001824 [Naegleria lovaniensis]|uniref:Poly [ADP-ribose] polymerase n=1 Tax=Naegleria lovaniensis TaxID=51637 RepID=A0AA88GV91_NAELO|nr:uncharacterized protein C9374_001824 [Naegleria lovaniensis]KAG2386789.1 hypothetical protein C9374_001824 [Naegleria lovaniensis]